MTQNSGCYDTFTDSTTTCQRVTADIAAIESSRCFTYVFGQCFQSAAGESNVARETFSHGPPTATLASDSVVLNCVMLSPMNSNQLLRNAVVYDRRWIFGCSCRLFPVICSCKCSQSEHIFVAKSISA